jgi:hypothetical protein
LTFTNADIVFVVDGQRAGPTRFDWTIDSGTTASETVISELGILTTLANAKEVYLTVLLPGEPAPHDQISFRLSAEQQGDCRLLIDKFAAGL